MHITCSSFFQTPKNIPDTRYIITCLYNKYFSFSEIPKNTPSNYWIVGYQTARLYMYNKMFFDNLDWKIGCENHESNFEIFQKIAIFSGQFNSNLHHWIVWYQIRQMPRCSAAFARWLRHGWGAVSQPLIIRLPHTVSLSFLDCSMMSCLWWKSWLLLRLTTLRLLSVYNG